MIKDDKASFLARRESRAASRELTQMLILGFGIGFIALLLGSYKYFVVQGVLDSLWRAIAWLGAFALLATLIYPFIWRIPEQVLRRFGNWVGHQIMTVVLVVIYYAFFWPVGALLRAIKGKHPIYEWQESASHEMEGWRTKELPSDMLDAVAQGVLYNKRRIGMFGILMFFFRRGHYFLIPALLVLTAIGIALFFLQTSALAPFIYTLF